MSPATGRAFAPQDAADDADPVAILSDRSWRNRFGSDPAAVGRDIVLDGRRHTIVGVMAADFWFDSKDVEVWLLRAFPRVQDARDRRLLMAIGRLRSDATTPSAQTEMQALAQRLAREHSQTNAGWNIFVTGLLPFGPGEKVFFGLVTTLTSLLLAAACAHIANLLLARGMERQGEISIRTALGARRGRIIRQLFVESAALSLLGGVCSVLVALPIIAQIRVLLGPRTSYLSDLALDGTALGVTAGFALLACVLFGLAPALRLSSVTAGDAMKQPPGGTIVGRRKRPLANALIGLEVAVATVALIVTALYARAADNVLAVPLGFEPENVVTFRLDVPEYKYPDADAAAQVLRDVHQRLEVLPSIKAAGAATRPPLNMGLGLPTDVITLEDRPEIPGEQSPGRSPPRSCPGTSSRLASLFFRVAHSTLGMGKVPGALRSSVDRWPGHTGQTWIPSVAGCEWDQTRPRHGSPSLASWKTFVPWIRISPGAADVHCHLPSRRDERSCISSPRAMNRSAACRAYRLAVREIDPELPVLDLQPMTEFMSTALSGAELGRKSLQVNAAITVLLAVSGVYSVVAFAVARRRREIAIRVAVGGSPSSIVSLILRQALRPALVGLAIGLVLSALLGRAITLMLFGVDPHDPLTYAVTTFALCLAAAVASCIPAIRATRTNSVAALRAE